ncbi:hypothetical protein [Roseomonas sp. CECT 9278]|uniref:hypothetical protein n=1 Tax=Roseomonas sp. CECT 9278 TaxID=2845823 RepID=UPI001E4318BC|nr:hypothetical protein [Roseomonas sp. CECT 9278]CAH0296084.1 hypothetical protein ROS9278_04382 [Roseomonas sp. CECT 9278]
MYAGLDALLEGAIAALVLMLPAVVLFWRLTALLGAGPRALRPAVTCFAAYGVMAAGGGLWAFNTQRPSLADEAITGLLVVGGLVATVAFLTLLLFPRKA